MRLSGMFIEPTAARRSTAGSRQRQANIPRGAAKPTAARRPIAAKPTAPRAAAKQTAARLPRGERQRRQGPAGQPRQSRFPYSEIEFMIWGMVGRGRSQITLGAWLAWPKPAIPANHHPGRVAEPTVALGSVAVATIFQIV